jgi:hypothetical protein
MRFHPRCRSLRMRVARMPVKMTSGRLCFLPCMTSGPSGAHKGLMSAPPGHVRHIAPPGRACRCGPYGFHTAKKMWDVVRCLELQRRMHSNVCSCSLCLLLACMFDIGPSGACIASCPSGAHVYQPGANMLLLLCKPLRGHRWRYETPPCSLHIMAP